MGLVPSASVQVIKEHVLVGVQRINTILLQTIVLCLHKLLMLTAVMFLALEVAFLKVEYDRLIIPINIGKCAHRHRSYRTLIFDRLPLGIEQIIR